VIVPRYSRRERKRDREAIAELSLGVLADRWVMATALADLVGVSVQQLHAALVGPVCRGVIDKRIEDVVVGQRHGRLPRVMYRRGQKQPDDLPEWLDPRIVPPVGEMRLVEFGRG
jgi:hypothetical protein